MFLINPILFDTVSAHTLTVDRNLTYNPFIAIGESKSWAKSLILLLWVLSLSKTRLKLTKLQLKSTQRKAE